MRYFFLIGVAALASCTHPPDEPAIEVRTITVDRPIPVACVDPKAIPAEPEMVGDELTGDAAHDADILAASAIGLRLYAQMLRALIEPCTKS